MKVVERESSVDLLARDLERPAWIKIEHIEQLAQKWLEGQPSRACVIEGEEFEIPGLQ